MRTEEVAAADDVVAAVRGGEAVHRAVHRGVRVGIDRGLPYLVVYRAPEAPDAGTVRLVVGEASYLLAEADADLGRLVRRIVEAGAAEYEAFLLLEVWARGDGRPDFTLRGPEGQGPATLAAFEKGLRAMVDGDPRLGIVETLATEERYPPGMPPLLSIHECWELGCLLVGLEVPPVYRDADAGAVYPVYLRDFRRRLSHALRQGFHGFIRVQTNCGIASYRMLGTRTLSARVLEADRELSEIERSYPFLLLVSPVNSDEEWQRFEANRYAHDPEFRYRLLPVDPDLLKRRLYGLDLEAVDDPSLAWLLRDKREELDKQVSLLDERGTPDFVHGSIRLYQAVDDALLGIARDVLATVRLRRLPPDQRWVGAEGFLARVLEEYSRYRETMPAFSSTARVRSDVGGLMVSNGHLLIPEDLRIRAERVEPLLEHEVGTHVLTYQNGAAQPLRQLATGLADYDELQEGLAVLSEYLVGGLDALRMRLLAARVVAAHSVERGATFVETFRLLHREHGFSARGAFGIAERVHTCGGFTRDLIYLRGLVRLLDHLRAGGELEPLYVGKIAEKHLPVVEGLRDRGVLLPPPLRPRFLERDDAHERLARLPGLSLVQMISPETA